MWGRGLCEGVELGFGSSGRPSYEQLAVLVVEQAATIRRLDVRVSELEGEVVELKRRLGANSRNSSRPPSSGGVAKPPATKSPRPPPRRRPGGRGGRVEGCGRGQLFELPEIRLHVTEHVAEARRCGCGRLTRADFPAGVSAPTQYGPRGRGLALDLIARQHPAHRRPAPLTLYSLHDKRGFDGLDHAGVLPAFAGIAVHDGFKPYRRYTNAQHALCNVHHLPELPGVIEPDPDDPKIGWAVRMGPLLRHLQTAVTDAKAAGHERLNPDELASYRAGYAQIIADGNQLDPPGTIPTGKRGVIRQTPARNLLTRLDHYRQDVPRFANDFRIPFDNNLAERDIRMIKLQQKTSGSWRPSPGPSHFLALRAYLSTAHKQG